MRFKALAVLCFFVLGLFVIVVFNSDNNDAELNQSRRMDWRKMEGLNWTQDQENGVKMRFQELKLLLEYHHNDARFRKSPERIALLLVRQGAIIEKDEKFITSEKDIAEFFGKSRGQSLTIGKMEIIDVGFINRIVNGHFVDHYVKLKYNIKLVTKEGDEILKNDDFPGTMTLMHRHNCPWDG